MARFVFLLFVLITAVPLAAGKRTEVSVGRITFSREINDKSAEDFEINMNMANNSNISFILLEINSKGGNCDAGFKMGKLIETSRHPVYCVVDWEADSMASYLLETCRQRYMTTRSRLMIHEASYENLVISGNSHLFIDIEADLRTTSDMLYVQYAKRLKISEKEIRERSYNRAWWIGPEEALETGAVDQVVTNVDDALELAKMHYEALEAH